MPPPLPATAGSYAPASMPAPGGALPVPVGFDHADKRNPGYEPATMPDDEPAVDNTPRNDTGDMAGSYAPAQDPGVGLIGSVGTIERSFLRGDGRDPDLGHGPHQNLGPTEALEARVSDGPGLRTAGQPGRATHPIGHQDTARPWKGRENGDPGNSDGTHVVQGTGADMPEGEQRAQVRSGRGNTWRTTPQSPSADEYYGYVATVSN